MLQEFIPTSEKEEADSLTSSIIGAAFESAYEACLIYELRLNQL